MINVLILLNVKKYFIYAEVDERFDFQKFLLVLLYFSVFSFCGFVFSMRSFRVFILVGGVARGRMIFI